MSAFDIDAFITELERLGVKLTTIRLADGTHRVNRWRMSEASAHGEQIERLWAAHINDNQTRMRLLAGRLLVRASTSNARTINSAQHAKSSFVLRKTRTMTSEPNRSFDKRTTAAAVASANRLSQSHASKNRLSTPVPALTARADSRAARELSGGFSFRILLQSIPRFRCTNRE
jgi:hypothetical protein